METTPAAPSAPPPLTPVEEPRRIDAIDAARGLALLGIFCVNIHFFAGPFGRILEIHPPSDRGPLDVAAFYFVKMFCEGKFYPLFSTLFGVGLVIQMSRAKKAGRRFVPLYLRRLVVLMLMGLCHGLLLWYGDILFIYSVAGLLLLACHRMSARALTIAGAVVLSLSVILGSAFSLLMLLPQRTSEVATPSTPGSDTPVAPSDGAKAAPPDSGAPSGTAFERFIEGFKTGTLFEEAGKSHIAPMQTSLWMEAETEAFKHGPYSNAVAMRAINFGFMLCVVAIGFGWSVIAMFFFGAAMMKSGVFKADRLAFHRRMVMLAAFIALPISIVMPLLLSAVGHTLWVILLVSLTQPLAGPLLALGYLSGVRLLVASGRLSGLTRVLASMGRMALTCYLAETIIATTIFYHFGFALFGEVGRAGRLGIVISVYLTLAALSVLWLRRFQFGPMEWIWRTLTYLRPQPMLRRQGDQGLSGNRQARL